MFKLLTTINEVFYDAVIYLVLVPKTLIKIFFNPGWIHRYVEGEIAKDPPERFKDFAQSIISYS